MKTRIEGRDKNYCTNLEALKGVAIIFASVAAFGLLANIFFDSDKKAEEARKKGYDV